MKYLLLGFFMLMGCAEKREQLKAKNNSRPVIEENASVDCTSVANLQLGVYQVDKLLIVLSENYVNAKLNIEDWQKCLQLARQVRCGHLICEVGENKNE